MTVAVTPTVTVDGTVVAGGLVGGALPPLVAVDALSLTWGRADLLSHPNPSRARVVLLDTGPGRPFASRRDLIGRLLSLAYTPAGGAARTNFLGRITAADVAPVERRGVRGSLVTLEASSLEVDAANYVQRRGSASWPAETFAARLSRILALLPAGLNTATLHPSWTGYTAAALDVSGRDALALLRQLYDSTARPLVYEPAVGFTYGRRRYLSATPPVPQTRAVVLSQRDPARPGKWITDVAELEGGGIGRLFGTYMDAARLEFDGGIVTDQQTTLTRVAVNWIAPPAIASTEDSGGGALGAGGALDESLVGRRVFTVDTMHGSATGAVAALAEWWTLVSGEVPGAQLDPVTFRTARTPFASEDEARLLLDAHEGSYAGWLVLQGSWLPEVRVSPIRAVIGGTIGYAAGEWTVQATLAPTYNANPLRPADAAYMRALYPTAILRDLDRTLTVGDFRYLEGGY